MAIVKSHEKKMSKLISYDYDHYDVVNCHWLWILKRWILGLTQEKMTGFDYCEEYVRSTSNKILLRQC